MRKFALFIFRHPVVLSDVSCLGPFVLSVAIPPKSLTFQQRASLSWFTLLSELPHCFGYFPLWMSSVWRPSALMGAEGVGGSRSLSVGELVNLKHPHHLALFCFNPTFVFSVGAAQLFRKDSANEKIPVVSKY